MPFKDIEIEGTFSRQADKLITSTPQAWTAPRPSPKLPPCFAPWARTSRRNDVARGFTALAVTPLSSLLFRSDVSQIALPDCTALYGVGNTESTPRFPRS